MQYTLRNIPAPLDRALRAKARREGRSLNQVAIEGLARALALDGSALPQRDLSDIAGTWVRDVKVTRALGVQRRIDPGLWR